MFKPDRTPTGLHCLVYVSRASRCIRGRFRDEVEAIVARSHLDNARRDVTGILVAHQGWFVQALEGERETLLELYGHIAADPRHEEVRTVSLEPIAARRFGRWGMCAGRLPAHLSETDEDLTTLSSAQLMALLSAARPSESSSPLSTVQALEVLDTLPEQQFDDIAMTARALARSQAAVVWLSDGRRRWFKAAVGLDACRLAVDAPHFAEVLAVPAEACGRPIVGGSDAAGYHACVPLDAAGRRVGVLCVADPRPLDMNAGVAEGLAALARSATSRLLAQADDRVAARLLGSATDAIVSADDEFRISFWNPAAERLFGRPAEEAIGLPLATIFPERLRADWRARLEAVRRDGVGGGDVLAFPALHADGGEFPAELTLAVWPEGERSALGAIIRDSTQRHLQEAALKAARAAAESANAAKSALLANMSHEIRTPLNGIVGVAGLLAAGRLEAREREMAELIRVSGEQLQRLLCDILDIARMEAGAVQAARESFSAAALARSALQLFSVAAGERGLSLELQVDPDAEGSVLGDPGRVHQIVSNLLSNAIKFTERGSVALSLSRAGASLYKIVVADTGIGFDPALKEQIFGRFQQADSSITRRYGGAGLGLAVCRQLVDLLGGQITCDSVPGRGTRFEVLLPLEPAPCSDAVEPAPPEGPMQGDAAAGRLSVLVADDNPTNRRLIELILDSLDADVCSVEDGALALEAFKLRPFDVVLMDMMMPVMDGLSATRAIRTHETDQRLAPTPVLMISANTLPEHIEAAGLAGVDRYVLKPVTAPQLIAAIDEALSEPAAQVRHVA